MFAFLIFAQALHENRRCLSRSLRCFGIIMSKYYAGGIVMEFTSTLDYFIAAMGILIIVVSFAWNIYEVFLHKAQDSASLEDSKDSAIR